VASHHGPIATLLDTLNAELPAILSALDEVDSASAGPSSSAEAESLTALPESVLMAAMSDPQVAETTRRGRGDRPHAHSQT